MSLRNPQTELACFVERSTCITCGSPRLANLASGYFDEDPVRSIIAGDPWGESPAPYLGHQQWIFVRCTECATAFHQRILAPEWMERNYSTWVTQEAMQKFRAHDTAARSFVLGAERVAHVLRIEKLTRNLPARGAVSLLDFGCGWGEFLSICNQFGFQTCGVDFSPDRRAHAFAAVYPSLTELKAKLARPLHAVTLFEVLEHLPDPLSVLKEISRLTEVGGLLVLETPDCTGIEDIKTKRDYRAIDPLQHINGFTPHTLQRIAMEAGYEPIRQGIAQVTADVGRVLKLEVKRVLEPMLRATTRRYFRKDRVC